MSRPLWKIILENHGFGSHASGSQTYDNRNMKNNTIEANIDYYDFVTFVMKGIVPQTWRGAELKQSGSVQASGTSGLKQGKVHIKRALIYARGAYQGWLLEKLTKRLARMDQDIDKELVKMEQERKAIRLVSSTDEPESTWYKALVKNRATLVSLMVQVEAEFKKMLPAASPLTLSAAYEMLWKTTGDDGQARKVQHTFAGITETVYVFNGQPGGINTQVDSSAYEEAIIQNRWHVAENVENYFGDQLLHICEDIHHSGMDKKVEDVLFGMAMSFIVAPTTMFDTLLMDIAILGPPGTGKSTIASSFSKLAHCLGWLSSPTMTSVAKSELISNEPGKTAILTQDFLDGHIGQCILIDEAYSLVEGTPGQEFADALTAFLTEHAGMIMVIVAGYVDDMNQKFFTANVGLPRRFPTLILLDAKTDKQLIYAFWKKYSQRRTRNNATMGALQNADSYHVRYVQFESMKILCEWVPIVCLLKRQKLDRQKTLLTSYFADVAELAQNFYRYHELKKLSIKPGYSIGDQKAHQAVVDGVAQTYEFDEDEILNNSVNAWILTKGQQWGVDHPRVNVVRNVQIGRQDANRDLQRVLDAKWDGNKWEDVLNASETLLWYNMDGGNFSALSAYGFVGAQKRDTRWRLYYLTGKVSVHLTRDVDGNSVSVPNDGLKFEWTNLDLQVALLDALGGATPASATVADGDSSNMYVKKSKRKTTLKF